MVHNNTSAGRDVPYFANCYFQRQVINYMINHRHLIYHNKYEALMSLYGVEDIDPSRDWNLPLSFKQYLKCFAEEVLLGGQNHVVCSVLHVEAQDHHTEY